MSFGFFTACQVKFCHILVHVLLACLQWVHCLLWDKAKSWVVCGARGQIGLLIVRNNGYTIVHQIAWQDKKLGHQKYCLIFLAHINTTVALNFAYSLLSVSAWGLYMENVAIPFPTEAMNTDVSAILLCIIYAISIHLPLYGKHRSGWCHGWSRW